MSRQARDAAPQDDEVLVPVTHVLRQAGTRHPLVREIRLDGLAVGDVVVPADEPVVANLVLEAIGEAITATGTVSTTARGACRRCQEPFDLPLAADVQEIFEVRPTEGETYLLSGDSIDLAPLLRDAVLLALPLAPLCDDACRGPAPDSFPTGSHSDDGDGDARAPTDPRWAALAELRLDG